MNVLRLFCEQYEISENSLLPTQDIQYSDIDYMDRQLDFTINETTYSGLEDFVRDLQATHSMKYDRTSHIQISVLLVGLFRIN